MVTIKSIENIKNKWKSTNMEALRSQSIVIGYQFDQTTELI